jgi:hypothetical protein
VQKVDIRLLLIGVDLPPETCHKAV